MLQLARGQQPSYDHSGTFNNNRFSMAASAAMLSSVLTQDCPDALFRRGEQLRNQADSLLRDQGFQATGWGSLIGIHPTDMPVARASDLADVDRRPIELLFHELLGRGIYIGKSGFVTLSLPQTPETDARFLEALESSLQVLARVLR
ncbi:hypothetical protein V1J52_22155 [Streptomyces sp. TRM 70351]|uniref:hypothetical protein n=1 Tax=Streptomyces sp. TRM 70351 TaxID=3116552 RepID=UPI002E7BF395|nr:hypothetical protein [Streptomyces sp. TRM 70351]MEE1930850.1 hypothetical protein [Streptomyces sp. TRM 70351]